MHIEEINNYSQLLDLRETWNKLLEKSPDNNVFLTWEWLSTWWKYYGRENQLMILVAEDDGKALAIAPLMRSVHRLFRFRIKKIEFIGATEHTDYCNFILAEKKMECI